MLARCRNPTNPRYGGAGVTVCDEWQKSFEAFLNYLGPRPRGTTLDRIDSRRGYEPGNVRWATAEQQNQNRKSTHWIEINGVRRCVAEWARIAGISDTCMLHRIRRGVTGRNLLAPPMPRVNLIARFGR